MIECSAIPGRAARVGRSSVVLFSWKWIEDYVPLDLGREELAHRLTMAGLPVDRMETVGEVPETVVVARVLEAARHPNADKLSLCTVNIGEDKTLSIVCGAPNVEKSQKVAVAVIGTTLQGGLKIKKVKIRGEESAGMLCSEKELGLSDESDGILVLPETSKIGSS